MSEDLPPPPATVVIDASLLVAAQIETERHHAAALHWMREIEELRYRIVLANHTLAEFYAGATKGGRVPPAAARALVEDFAANADRVAALSTEDYLRATRRVAKRKLTSGIIYDAIIAQVARQHDADYIATLNGKHFEQIFPPGRVITPA